MAFWAMKAFEKVKGLSEQTTKKLKGYVQTTPEKVQVKPQQKQQTLPKKQKKVLSEADLMQIQLRQYKKLVVLQQKVLGEYKRRERAECQARQKQLQDLNRQLMLKEEQQRINRQKQALIHALESGQKSIQDVIHENIQIKEKLYLASLS